MSTEDRVRASEQAPKSGGLPSPREIFDIAQDGFLSLDAEGRILYANPRAETLFGFPRGQAQGVDFATLVSEDQNELVREALRSLTVGGIERQVRWQLSLRAVGPGGAELPVEMSATAVPAAADWTV